MALRVTVQTATPADVSAFARLSADEYGADSPVADPQHVTWKHVDSPFGRSTAVDLRSVDDVVGRLWVQPRRWRVRGQAALGMNPTDLLIGARHRDLLAFLKLWRKVAAEAAGRGDFWYHTSNPVSDELYSKMLHYKPVLELDGHVLPLQVSPLAGVAGIRLPRSLGFLADTFLATLVRLVAVLTGRLTGISVEDGLPRDDELRALCDSHHAAQAVSAERSRASLAWRWADSGGVGYWRSSVRDRRGRLVAVLLVRLMDTEGVSGAFVVDIVGSPQGALSRVAMWLEVGRRAAGRGGDALFLFCNRENLALRSLAGLPWLLVPRPRLPQRIPVFVHGDDVLREDLSRAYMTLADFDMF